VKLVVGRNNMKILASIIAGLLIANPVAAYDGYEKYLSLLGFKLEETNLNEIRKELGASNIIHTGDAAASYYALCYVSPDEKKMIIFESGEMGGGDHTLLSFIVKKANQDAKNCSKLGKAYTNYDVGVLSVGQNFEAVRREMPQPITETKNGVQHKHFGKIPFTKKEIEKHSVQDMKYANWDVSIFIDVYIKQGIVSGYKVSKVTSW
jgi:hypothetical protein